MYLVVQSKRKPEFHSDKILVFIQSTGLVQANRLHNHKFSVINCSWFQQHDGEMNILHSVKA